MGKFRSAHGAAAVSPPTAVRSLPEKRLPLVTPAVFTPSPSALDARLSSLELRAVDFACLVPLFRCNQRCRYCHLWEHGFTYDERIEVPTHHWLALLDDLAALARGPVNLTFAGGEPLLRPDMPEMIGHASRLGMAPNISTNGSLIDAAMADRLIAAGLKMVSLSLDAAEPGLHDRIRRWPGAWEAAMRAVALLVERDPSFFVTFLCVISGENLRGLPALIDFVDRDERVAHVNFQCIADPFAREPGPTVWREMRRYDGLWPRPDEAVEALDAIIARRRAGSKVHNDPAQLRAYQRYFRAPDNFRRQARCGVGDHAAHVDPYGDVYLCLDRPPVGNIVKSRFADLWYEGAEVRARRHEMNHCTTPCHLTLNCLFEE
ncbi:MAG: radical SAM protein [Planctomycetes bacterium]|nr:radical SAM protein [Planctomycetota bacterium]